MILVKSPYRVSLFGGGTDYLEYINENKYGLCIGFAIDKYSYVSVRKLPKFFDYQTRLVYSDIEHVKCNTEIKHDGIRCALEGLGFLSSAPLEITHTSDLPAKTGLGTSSAFMVALIRALQGLNYEQDDPNRLALVASSIERSYSKVGLQDHYFSSFGGCGELDIFGSKDYKMLRKISYNKYDHKVAEFFDYYGLLFYTGQQRKASDVVSTYIDKLSQDKNQKLIFDIANEASERIHNGNYNTKTLGDLLNRTWSAKKQISPNITNNYINSVYDAAIKVGADGGKLLGAGGGGCLFFLVDIHWRNQVIYECEKLGCIHIPYSISRLGCERII